MKMKAQNETRAQMIDLQGTTANFGPMNHDIGWMYPNDGSTLSISICHVRVVDEVRIRFDFSAHEWVAEQEEHDFLSEHGTGVWVEVARWSGNAPKMSSHGPGKNEPVTK